MEHERFKAIVKEVKGSIVTLEAVDYFEAVVKAGSQKFAKVHEGYYTIAPVLVSKEIIGKIVRVLL